jgi:hypothetical protein
MAGQSTINNTFTTESFPDFDLTSFTHTNENSGGVPPTEDHQHFLFQQTFVINTSGEKDVFQTFFDNGGVASSGPGDTFNLVFHAFPADGFHNFIDHENNHVVDHSLLDAIQQPQADLTNLQQAAADTVSAHDAGLQPDLHAANVQATAFHLV